jgi:putative SOS response-associated peptidase YedK
VPDETPGEVQMFQWGLVPFWVKDRAAADAIRLKTFNARAESITEKPSFRHSIRNKRCLVISRGFFEWQQRDNIKIPYYIYLDNEEPFAFAGIYDNWSDPGTGEYITTFSIITTRANPLLEKIHNTKQRMPVILPADIEKEWLNRDTDPEKILNYLNPYDEKLMKAHTVSRKISIPGVEKNVPDIIEPFGYDELPLT